MYASGSPVHAAHALFYLQMQTVSSCHNYILLMHNVLCVFIAIRDKLYFCERKKPANQFRIFLLQNVICQEFKYFTFSLVSMIKSDVGN